MTTATLPLAQPRLFHGRDYYPKIKTIDSFATLQPIRADGYDNVTPQQPMVNERSERLRRMPSSLPSPLRGTMLMLLLSTGGTRLRLAYPLLNEGLPLSGAGCDTRIVITMTPSR